MTAPKRDPHSDLTEDELLPLTIRECLGERPSPEEFAAWLKGEPPRRRARPWLVLALVGGAVGLGTAAFQGLRRQEPRTLQAARAPARSPADLRRQAEALQSARAFGRAEALYLQIYENQNADLDALERAAYCALMRGDFDRGFARYLAVAEADPERREAACIAAFGLMFARPENRIVVSFEAPEDARIKELLERAWAGDWEHPARALWQLYGAQILGDPELVTRALRRYQEADHGAGSPIPQLPSIARAALPKDLGALQAARRRRGIWAAEGTLALVALMDRGLLSEALQRSRAWVEAEPKNAAAHGTLARCLRELGRSEEARAAYEKALAIDPGSALLLGEMTAAALADEAFVEAQERLGRSSWDKLYPPYADLLEALTDTGDIDALLAFYRQADVDDPLRGFAATRLYALTLVEHLQGSADAVDIGPEREVHRDKMRWELYVKPTDLSKRLDFARALEAGGRTDQAARELSRVYERALALKTAKSAKLRDRAALEAGRLAFRYGQFDRARSWLHRACREDRPLAKACVRLARGDIEAAAYFLEDVRWNLEPGGPLDEAVQRLKAAARHHRNKRRGRGRSE